MTIKFDRHNLIYNYKFTSSLFYTTYKLKNDKTVLDFKGNFYF